MSRVTVELNCSETLKENTAFRLSGLQASLFPGGPGSIPSEA